MMTLRSVEGSSVAPAGFAAADLRTRIRVVVVDDHPVICEALAASLCNQSDMEYCGRAGTARAALDLISATRPDVTVVDLSLPDAYGLTLVSDIRAAHPEVQVVVYSMGGEPVFAERAIRAGALGYVSKSEPTSTVMEAIRTVFDSEVFLTQGSALRMLNQLMGGGADREPRLGLERLTNQEMAVVHLLGMGNSIGRIAALMKLSYKTVQTYQRRAREKLGCDSTGELLKSAMRWAGS